MAPRITTCLATAIRVSMAGMLTSMLVACSTAKPPPELGSAQRAYQEAAAEADVSRYASVPLYEAKKELDRANEVWKKSEDADRTAHIAALAEKRVEIANAVAAGAKAEAETKELLESRRRIELQIREKEIAALKAKPTDSGMVLTLGGDVLFKTGSSTVSPGAQAQLDRVAQFLNDNPDREVVVTGHTDSSGSAEMNQLLSERRAAAVGSYLSARGVSASRIATRGFGQSMPMVSNDTPTGRQQNRRVDIVILNVGEKASEHVLARP